MKDLVYLLTIMAGYDHLASIRTLDPSTGKVLIHTSAQCRQQVLDILASLIPELYWQFWDDLSLQD
ncbi:DUF4911 domain-containing protein [bacterium]|nr:DUF4911 domain-containing protein [bacterium]